MNKVLPVGTQPSSSSIALTSHGSSHTGGLKTLQSSASMGSSFVIAQNGENTDPNFEETEPEMDRFSNFCECSIRTTLMILVSSLLILSIIIVIATFCASFLPGFLLLSNEKRESDFSNIVKISDKIMRELVVANTVTQMQFESNYDIYNYQDTELKMFRAFKAQQVYHDEIFVATYVGDTYGHAFCIIKWDDGPAFLNISPISNEFYYCRDYENTDFCNRTIVPDVKTEAFDLSYLVQVCNENPGKLVFSLSYVDPSIPDLTFISLLKCVSKKSNKIKPGSNFEYYYGIDMTTATISSNMKSLTENIEGSRAYIVEYATGFMIASYDGSPVTNWGPNKELKRLKPSDSPNEDIKKVDESIRSQFPNGYGTLEPGKFYSMASGNDYVEFERLKTEYGIDWIFVLSVPQWNYTSPIAIALIASLACSIIAIIIGLIVGVFVSIRLVKPFHTLIQIITSISTIDIETADLTDTMFSEVRDLQFQFYQMIKRLKLYRSFIPPHLIQEIEKLENETDERKQQDMIKKVSTQSDLQKNESSLSFMSSGHNLSSRRKKSVVAKSTINRFALYLEKRIITVLYMSMDGILDCFDTLEHSDLVTILSDIFEQVNQIGKTTSGLVFGFENGSLMIAFNASSNQATHQEKAANAALTLIGKLDSVRKTKWNHTSKSGGNRQVSKKMDNISFRFCIMSRETTCGNVGTNEAKIFSIFGNLREEFEMMTTLARELEIQILVTESIHQATYQLFVMRYIDTKEMKRPFYNQESHSNHTNENCHLYELIESKAVQHDEWMFELEEKKRKEKWKLYNEASNYYKEKQYERAMDLFKIFLSDHHNDKPTQHLITQCQNKVQLLQYSCTSSNKNK